MYMYYEVNISLFLIAFAAGTTYCYCWCRCSVLEEKFYANWDQKERQRLMRTTSCATADKYNREYTKGHDVSSTNPPRNSLTFILLFFFYDT